MATARLTSAEVYAFVETILGAVAALEDEGELPRASWPQEMREWCDLLVERLHEGNE